MGLSFLLEIVGLLNFFLSLELGSPFLGRPAASH
ncbi:hypothetical protein SLEP1_g22571 [Rubroshorea leprosula]|uniref:Uncharacterized protein n=1 Tax=Rubroshorea leprosula TaxID=152421 RepID=A0AAV5JK23_9ROSI|nr:hypothetical protein SLEP1_g22571 [Rubroshorea leprosula]